MKKFFMFFVTLYRFVVNLFSSKKPAVTIPEKIEEAKEEAKKVFRLPKVHLHNNRKNTRGRFTQYIHEADGSSKAIYHDVRN